jgi:predicted 3-demethylubiquinone-9 3-methyltransferase (glyoxalase superfamily)
MQIATFLMFTGAAEEAMRFYVSLFPRSRIVSLERYGPNEQGAEGSVKRAEFEINATRFMCIDSPVKHEFDFTPSISLFVSSSDEAKIARYFEALADGGQILMPLDAYPFSKKFGWVQDRFGVSWQLNTT